MGDNYNMKKNEIIELNGVEYTLELNRDSFLQIDKICNVQKSMEIIQKGLYEYVDEIDDNHVRQIPIPLLKNKEIQARINELALLANQKRYEAYLLEQRALKVMDDEVIYAK